MGIFDFFKRNKTDQKSDINRVVTNNHQLSPIITNSQQSETDKYSKRDLHYARRIGQIEEMSENISSIKDKLTALDVKFELRVPEKVLTEGRFDEEVLSSKNILDEITAIRNGLSELERTITNKQQLLKLDTIRENANKIETNLREVEIKRNLKGERLATDELGEQLGLSRSRTNQILIEMEQKGIVSRVKYGKKYFWTVKTI